MKKAVLTVLALAISGGACATTNDSNQKIAALEKELQNRDNELARLKGDDASLKSAETKADDLSRANRDLSRELKDEIAKGNVTINQLRDRLTVSVLQEVLFGSGKTEIGADPIWWTPDMRSCA